LSALPAAVVGPDRYAAVMPRPLLVGVQLPEVEWEVPFNELVVMAQTAEQVGFDSIWLGDHLLYDLPVGPRGPWEVWTSLAALAVSTERVLLGPLVASTSFHNPTMLAKQAVTVDAASKGRLLLGLGAGWNEREYGAFGFPYDHRVDRFAEAFIIIRTLLSDGAIDFHGDYYTAERCVLHPRAARPGGPPLMVGSIGPRMLSLTLPHVQAWNVWWSDFGNTPDGFAVVKERVDRACFEAGRIPGSVDATCAVHVQLEGGNGRQMGSYNGAVIEPLRGTPADIAAELQRYADVGCKHVQLVVDPITRDSIEALAEVLAVLDGE
jgi:alkanesulfonate monooxygenase SsuD/methylene tetrahydromethanopterin reductase-like flavin-dependent oxidoreductase (luciferase family)